MCALSLFALLVAAPVALYAEDAQGVSHDDQTAILVALAEMIEAHSGLAAVVDEDAGCAKKDRCFVEIVGRTGASDVVFVRLLGVPTRIRMIVERAPGAKVAEIDLLRSRDGWTAALTLVAGALFDPVPASPPEPVALEAEQPVNEVHVQPALAIPNPKPPQHLPVPKDSGSWAPWIVLGAGMLALTVGTGFGLSSRDARSDALEVRPHPDAEVADLEDRARGHGVAANILFAASALGIGAGIVLLVSE